MATDEYSRVPLEPLVVPVGVLGARRLLKKLEWASSAEAGTSLSGSPCVRATARVGDELVYAMIEVSTGYLELLDDPTHPMHREAMQYAVTQLTVRYNSQVTPDT